MLPLANTSERKKQFRCVFHVTAALLFCAASVTLRAGSSHHHHHQSASSSAPGDFDYYVLALSWAPAFCAGNQSLAKASECAPGSRFGLVVHGLWPQRESGPSPETCGPVRPVSEALVDRMLAVMPARGLIQHEWQAHGSCSGLAPNEYFANIRTAFAQLRIPDELQSPSQAVSVDPTDIERQIATINRITAPNVAHVACRSGELTEIRVCLAKNLSPRSCTENVGECRAGQISIRPTR